MKNNIIKPDPKTPKKKDYDFRDIEFLAMIAHAIAGGVESPLQLAFQVSALDTYLVKFIYSEKATKFREIFPLLLTVCTVVNFTLDFYFATQLYTWIIRCLTLFLLSKDSISRDKA